LLRGIYSSASGMLMEMEKVSVHASNIANAQSAGFKRRDMAAVPFKEMMVNVLQNQGPQKIGKKVVDSLVIPVGAGASKAFQEIDNAQGSLKPTGKSLDFAIEGNGWFTLKKATDGTIYTSRNGVFMLNEKGELINGEGDFVLDTSNQPIVIDNRNTTAASTDKARSLSRLSIKENGDIFDRKDKIATMQIKTDTDRRYYIPQLNLAVHEQEQARTSTPLNGTPGSRYLVDKDNKRIMVKQGFVEESNVSIISEMVGLIHSSKSYESGHKLIMSEDKILDKAINELGRTG